MKLRPTAQAITAAMVEAAHDADIAGGEYGRYRRIIAAVWPHIAASEREACGRLAEAEVIKLHTLHENWADISAGALEDFAALLREQP